MSDKPQRPKVRPNKDVPITFRVTKEQRDKIEQMARSEGKYMSEFIVERIFGGSKK